MDYENDMRGGYDCLDHQYVDGHCGICHERERSMPWIKCQYCKREAAKEQTWWVCNVCGFRVCCDCVHRHTGSYSHGGSKCSQCDNGQMELRPNG